MKETIIFILSIVIMSCGPSNKEQKVDERGEKLKVQKSYTFYYSKGVVEKTPSDSCIIHFDRFGNKAYVQTGSSLMKYIYENDTLLTSVTERFKENGIIVYKKIIKYNKDRKKQSLRIYKSYTSTNVPELVAGMNFYYDSLNQISAKSYFGDINHVEEELESSISSDKSLIEREAERKVDSTLATFVRNSRGEVSKIYFNNDTANKIIYTYNANGQLLSQRVFQKTMPSNKSMLGAILSGQYGENSNSFTGLKYYYQSDSIERVEKIVADKIKKIQLFNKEGALIEERVFGFDNELLFKWVFERSEDGKIRATTKFDNIEEPVFVERYDYDYY